MIEMIKTQKSNKKNHFANQVIGRKMNERVTKTATCQKF